MADSITPRLLPPPGFTQAFVAYCRMQPQVVQLVNSRGFNTACKWEQTGLSHVEHILLEMLQTRPDSELQAHAIRLRARLLSPVLIHLWEQLGNVLAVEDEGVRHHVTATFPRRAGATVGVFLDSLDYAARLRVAVALSRPQLASAYEPRGGQMTNRTKAPLEVY